MFKKLLLGVAAFALIGLTACGDSEGADGDHDSATDDAKEAVDDAADAAKDALGGDN